MRTRTILTVILCLVLISVTVGLIVKDDIGQNETDLSGTRVNVIPDISAASVDPTTIAHNADSDVTFSCTTTDSDGTVDNVTVECSALWTGAWYLTKGTGDTWTGTFAVLEANITGTGENAVTFKSIDNVSEYNNQDVDFTIVTGNTAPTSTFSLSSPYAISEDEDSENFVKDLWDLVTDTDEVNVTFKIGDLAGTMGTSFTHDNFSVALEDDSWINITFEADMNNPGIPFTVNATDQGFSLELNITVEIGMVNDIPGEPTLTVATEAENLTVNMTIEAPDDADGETAFDYEIDWGDGGLGTTEKTLEGEDVYALYTYAETGNAFDLYSINVTVEDAAGDKNYTLSDEINITAPPSGPENFMLGFSTGALDTDDRYDEALEVVWTTCTVATTIEEDTPAAGTNTMTTVYTFAGTCGDDIFEVHLYSGFQTNDGDFTYYTAYDMADIMDMKAIVIEPASGAWDYDWEYVLEYEPVDPVDPPPDPPTDVYHYWYAAVGWTEDTTMVVGETEADIPNGGGGTPEPTWELSIDTETDLEDANSDISVTFDTCTMKAVEEDGLLIDTITTTYTFKGTCSEDVTAIYLYTATQINDGTITYFPAYESLTKIEITPDGTSWDYTYEVDSFATDLVEDTNTYVYHYLAVAWTDDAGYNSAEIEADFTEKADKDPAGEGFLAALGICLLIPIIAFVLFVVIVIVIIVVLVKKSKKKKAAAAEAEAAAASPPVMCFCGTEIPGEMDICPSCAAPKPQPQDQQQSQDLYGGGGGGGAPPPPGQDMYAQQPPPPPPGQDPYGAQPPAQYAPPPGVDPGAADMFAADPNAAPLPENDPAANAPGPSFGFTMQIDELPEESQTPVNK